MKHFENLEGKIVGKYELSFFSDSYSLRRWLDNCELNDKTYLKEIIFPIGLIVSITVNEQERNKGYGNQILKETINKCIGNSCDKVLLIADLNEEQQKGFSLIKWYEINGFDTIGWFENNPVMEKQL